MLKSLEHKKLLHYSYYGAPNFKDYSEVWSADPPISYYYFFLRLGGPAFLH